MYKHIKQQGVDNVFIYKITNSLTGKVYIGQTIRNPQTRFYEHMNDKLSNDYFHSAVRKYGADAFTYEVIDTAENQEELNRKEMMWIKYYNAYAKDETSNGYNTNYGGDMNPMCSEVVKEKHQNSMRSDDVRARISQTMKRHIAEGEFFTENHRKRISEAMRGNKNFQGHKRTPEAIAATAKSLHKRVHCIDESGNVVARFDAVVEAARWWYDNGYREYRELKNYKDLSNVIKDSSKKDRFILGLKWIYD